MTPPKPVEVLRFIARNSKRAAVTVAGGALVLGGLALLVLPGPGIVVVALGLAVLGTEYMWAAKALEHTKRSGGQAGRAARRQASRAAGGAWRMARSVARRRDPGAPGGGSA